MLWYEIHFVKYFKVVTLQQVLVCFFIDITGI